MSQSIPTKKFHLILLVLLISDYLEIFQLTINEMIEKWNQKLTSIEPKLIEVQQDFTAMVRFNMFTVIKTLTGRVAS